MTNEQLLILIRAWRIGERQEGDFLELGGLKTLLAELDQAIEVLQLPKSKEDRR